MGYFEETGRETVKPDAKTVRNKVWLRLLGSPLTVVPFLCGVTAWSTSWTFDWNVGLGSFIGLAGLLGSAGVFLTRFLLGGEKLAGEVMAELEREALQAQQKVLDQLDHRLATSDEDPRPETALRDLRALLKAYEETASGASALHLSSVIDIHSRVREVFDQCVVSLEKTIKLWETARKLSTPEARKPILEQREQIIADIQASIKQLSDTLVGLQTLGQGHSSTAALERLRGELDQSLEVAKMVEARVNSLVKDVSEPLPTNPQNKG